MEDTPKPQTAKPFAGYTLCRKKKALLNVNMLSKKRRIHTQEVRI